MIVDAALAHARERELDRAEIASVVQPRPGAPEKFQHHRLWKFRRAAHAAVDRIDHAGDLGGGAVELGRAISALRFCSMLCGSWRKTRSTSRMRSTKAGLP